MVSLYLKKEKDKIRTMLAGTPLSAEKIRMSGEALGGNWYGTSWFFLMHIIAKALSKNEVITFNGILQTVDEYGIERWKDEKILKERLDRIVKIFKMRGLENVYKDKYNSLRIDGSISKPEFHTFAQSQYDYSMTDGLVHFDKISKQRALRGTSDYAERIFWHYITTVYDCPQIYESPEGDSLTALVNDIIDKLEGKYESQGIKIWERSDLKYVKYYLKEWERNLVSKNILFPLRFGDTSYISPSFYSKIDFSVFEESREKGGILELINELRKYPGFPVYKGDESKYDLAKRLQRAGAVRLVEEQTAISPNHYVYLVSGDIFNDLDKRIQFRYSSNPNSEYGDGSLTQDIFKILGRLWLFSRGDLPQKYFMSMDAQAEIGRILHELEDKGESELGSLEKSGIFDPLEPLNVIRTEGNSIIMESNFDWVIGEISDYYSSLVNDPDLTNIEFPPKEVVEKVEKERTRKQIMERTKSYFRD